ncbi:MAG: ADP-ribosylglycohydrolase family protein [Bryobacteraceae bacterium]
MRHRQTIVIAAVALAAVSAHAADRQLTVSEYRDKVYGAWIGQIIGASYGFNFEGKARNAIDLDHFLNHYDHAVVDDDYYYEMVALYGFERFGLSMTAEQLGDMWKEYNAGTWGSSEQARLALERGIQAPDSGSPRYNRWFHTIGPEFSSDIYGMISPGMVNLAGAIARKYSHVNGYAEGSDGAVFVAACISEAFFEASPVKIVRQAAQLIDPRSNYRKAIDFVLAGYEQGKPWQQIAAESEARWRPDYPQLNNSVANGALVAIGILYGDGDYLKSINTVTQAGDFTDADCNAANVSSVIGAMHGFKAIPAQLVEPLHNRVYGDHMGPLKLGRTIDERIDDLARRVADVGQKNLLANGARRNGETLVIPQQTVRTQPLEFFDINEYGSLWNPDWRLEGASRGGAGATYLDGDVLVTFPRDTRPCMLERELRVPEGAPKLTLEIGYLQARPWRLQIFAGDDNLTTQIVGDEDTINTKDVPSNAASAAPNWTTVNVDLSKYAGKSVRLRLYQWLVNNRIPGAAYWRSARVE